MHPYILDIDGTLMPSAGIDNACYWQAVGRVFGVSSEVLALDGFANVTDSGILQEWHLERYGTEPPEDSVSEVRQAFIELTRIAAEQEPAHFQPVAGLEPWLDLQIGRGVPLALATGGWGHTARFKLEISGLARYRLPLASSDDAISRVSIMRAAHRMVLGGDEPDPPAHCVTFIGDGIWDLRASRELGWKFIGLASDSQRRRLLEEGAERVVPDFRRLVPDGPRP